MVEPARLSRAVDRLASFGTRHTLSSAFSRTRGIGAARTWLAGEFDAATRLPGSRLIAFEDDFPAEPGPLLARPVELANLGVLLPGVDPDRARQALVVVAHYDSRVSDPADAAADAPGAVANASGVALVLEMARVLAAQQPAIGIYFVATAAGEQGGLGSIRLAQRLKGEGTEIVGMVAADSVGNSLGSDGAKAGGAVRLFSEDGVPAQETDGQRRIRELLGTGNDGGSRELARYLKRAGERFVDGLDCLVMLRKDRIGQTGEQGPFTRGGYPGVEVTELADNYDRLRQSIRTDAKRSYGDTATFFDAAYCARITRMLVAGFRQLAFAPAAPQNVGLGGCGSSNAKLWWNLPEDPRITGIVIYRRRADTVQWQGTAVFPKAESMVLPGVGTDTDVFAVATVDAQGNESLPVSPRSIEF
jgi:acetylornithine deacetylase/succinyl-diaminopimelate desuccinylase-like protein